MANRLSVEIEDDNFIYESQSLKLKVYQIEDLFKNKKVNAYVFDLLQDYRGYFKAINM